MQKQDVADYLTKALGKRVSIGLHSSWEQIKDLQGEPIFHTDGEPIQEYVERGELFTFADTGEMVPAELVDQATKYVLAHPPAPPEPSEEEIVAEAIRAKLTAQDIKAARQRLMEK